MSEAQTIGPSEGSPGIRTHGKACSPALRRRPAPAGLWHHRHRARCRAARHPYHLLVITGLPAFVQTKVDLEIYIDPAKVDAKDPAKGNFRVHRPRCHSEPFPGRDRTKSKKADLTKILSSDAPYIVRDYVVAHPDTIGKRITLPHPRLRSLRSAQQGRDPQGGRRPVVEPGALVQSSRESRRGGRGRRTHRPQARSLYRPDQDRGLARLRPAISPPWRGTACRPICPTSTIPASSPCWPMMLPTPSRIAWPPIRAWSARRCKSCFPCLEPFQVLAKGGTPKVPNPRFSAGQIERLRCPHGQGARAYAIQLGAVLQRR